MFFVVAPFIKGEASSCVLRCCSLYKGVRLVHVFFVVAPFIKG